LARAILNRATVMTIDRHDAGGDKPRSTNAPVDAVVRAASGARRCRAMIDHETRNRVIKRATSVWVIRRSKSK